MRALRATLAVLASLALIGAGSGPGVFASCPHHGAGARSAATRAPAATAPTVDRVDRGGPCAPGCRCGASCACGACPASSTVGPAAASAAGCLPRVRGRVPVASAARLHLVPVRRYLLPWANAPPLA